MAGSEKWVLWQKSIRRIDDVLTGEVESVMTARALFEKASFAKVFDQMVTFEKSQAALGVESSTAKTPAKLGGDYFRQFAWREGLMMSTSGRLYPVSDKQIYSSNYFDEQDLIKAKEFLQRLETEKFVPVPIEIAAIDWEKSYASIKDRTNERLNVLYNRYNDDKNSLNLAVQIIGQEEPEVLFAHIKRGFNPKTLETNPALHYAALAAAIERSSVEPLQMLSQAGLAFDVRHEDKTPVEAAIDNRRYSHLFVMLSRDGATLANYTDNEGHTPAVHAVKMQDRQAFRMLYLEGLDFSLVDNKGYALVHHAFENNFIPGVYAWIDEGLSIDEPVKDSKITGLSIARHNGFETLVEFALKNGADANAPALAAPKPQPFETAKPFTTNTDVVPFTVEMLSSPAANADIEKSAQAFVDAGGDLNITDAKGVSLFELCWKNKKPNPDFDRRALLPKLAALGADSSAQLPDGTTVLTRALSGITFDAEYIKAIAPYAKNVNNADSNGNNILHALQINKNDAVGHSSNVATLIKLFPDLDANERNGDGNSTIGLANSLNRTQTLKALPATLQPDWSQTTQAGWSYLDLAFTKACGFEKVSGAPKADKIAVASDATRAVVLDMVEKAARTGTAAEKASLSTAFTRQRPDGKTLFEALAEEQAAPAITTRLQACAQQATKAPPPAKPSINI